MSFMKLELIRKGARYAVIGIDDGGRFYTAKEHTVTVNGEFYRKTNKSINCIWGLKPDEHYVVETDEGQILRFDTEHEFVTLNVRKFGAVGDGVNDDTVFIQAAIAACPPNSRVLVPKGIYKVTNIFLKNDVRIELAQGAVLLADNSRYTHAVFPGMTQSYDGLSEYNLGTWEGNPLPMFAGIITAINVSDAEIYGEGEIDGNASGDNWWFDEKKMRGAFRPRTVFIGYSNYVALVGLKIHDSPSWTVHPYFSENIDIIGTEIVNPMNSPNTDGIDVESCVGVYITGARMTLGDDCIAVKSGKIYMAKYHGITENINISRCLMENGHGAVTLGSEMSSGIKNVIVENCDFVKTDRGLRIKTRRGRGYRGIIGDVIFRNISMDGVLTPFVVNCFYFCDLDGRTEYVQTREKLPVDERTPLIKKLIFSDIKCIGTNYAAAYFIGLPEQKIEEIIMRNISVSYAENAAKGVPAMHCGVEEMCRRGIYANNVKIFKAYNVKLCGNAGGKYEFCDVDSFVEGEGL